MVTTCNRSRAGIVLIGWGSAASLMTGAGLDLANLVVFAAVFGFGGTLNSLAISKWTAKRLTRARVITEPSGDLEVWLVQTVRRQAMDAGIGMPEVAIYEAADVNAFATGMRRNNALVAVSTGLLRSLSRDEAEAVLGHEVSHVANGDMVTLALIQGVVNTFVIVASRVVGHLVDRVVFKTERGHGPAFYITSIPPSSSSASSPASSSSGSAAGANSAPSPGELPWQDAKKWSPPSKNCGATSRNRTCPTSWRPSASPAASVMA